MFKDERSTNSRVGFDTLPDELKVRILRYALVTKNPILARNHKALEERLNLPTLLVVNKRMRILAAEVYYSCNTFVIRRSTKSWKNLLLGDDYKWRYPPFAYGHFMRKLVIQMQVYTQIDDAARCLEPVPDNDWLVLLRPRPALMDSNAAADPAASPQTAREDWQSHFPELTELTVRLSPSLSLYLQLRQDRDSHKQAFLDLPDQATVALRPKQLKVESDSGKGLSPSDSMHGAICEMVKLRV